MRPVALIFDPPAMPHVCIKCGAHAQIREWFVDIGTETEWEGIVYICNSCMSDIVRVTPSFLSVEAHREIIAEYIARMDELTELKQRMSVVGILWMNLTGNSLEIFMDNLTKVDEYVRVLSGAIPESSDNQSTVVGDSSEPKPSDNLSNESEPGIVPDIIFTS